MGRGETQRQRKMKVTIVLFAACVASLSAAGLRTEPGTTVSTLPTTTTVQCPASCCPKPTEPTPEPTAEPTAEPNAEATDEPTAEPTAEATAEPTAEPTA